MITASEALEKLAAGNKEYVRTGKYGGDVSAQIREQTVRDGQFPYAVILCCSDSREIPEAVFSAGIGDLFVIRVAGNVVGDHELGSIEYAAGHLGTKLIVVLGHDHCGAVGAALHNEASGKISTLTSEIIKAIGDEKDEVKASCLNVQNSVAVIREDPEVKHLEENGLKVMGALYHLESGEVEFL